MHRLFQHHFPKQGIVGRTWEVVQGRKLTSGISSFYTLILLKLSNTFAIFIKSQVSISVKTLQVVNDRN